MADMILKNTTAQDRSFGGVNVRANSQRGAPSRDSISENSALLTDIASGAIVISDGTSDLSPEEGKSCIVNFIEADSVVYLTGTRAIVLHRGTTAQRPVGINGMVRYNEDLGKLEAFQNGSWGGATSVDRQQATSAVAFITTSQTLVDLADMSLTTNDLSEAGTYTITFSCEFESENSDQDNDFSLNAGGTAVASRRVVAQKKNEFNTMSLTYLAAGIANGTVIKVQVAQHDTDNASDELTINDRQLVIDGVGDSNVI